MNSLKDSNSHRIPKILSNTRSSCHPNRFSSFYSLNVLLSGSFLIVLLVQEESSFNNTFNYEES